MITREQYIQDQTVTTNPAAGRHFPDAPDVHETLNKVWYEYIEESYHEGSPVSLEDFIEYVNHVYGRFSS
jgi:hypothetical protein